MAPQSTENFPEISDKIIHHIARGDEAETIEMLHPLMREDLPWSDIAQVWTSMLTECGELREITDQKVVPLNRNPDAADTDVALSSKSTGTSVVVSTLNHEAGEFMSRIAINRDGAVVGILFLPPDATEYPF